MEPTTSALGSDDEWELCNDDGFVYKRKKRRPEPSTQPPPDPVADPQEDERRRREHKRRTLLKLKTRFQREISNWETLSNTLRAMEENVQQSRVQLGRSEEGQGGEQMALRRENADKQTERGCGSLVDELLSQVEAQEAIIRDISNLCDIAEAMCNAREEQFRQSLFDLPIWASPQELISSLCEE